MRITLAQLDPVVGDVTGNVGRILETLQASHDDRPDLVVFPEMFLAGYPPKDLLERRWFLRRVTEGIDEVCRVSRLYPDTGILFGAPLPDPAPVGKGLRNSGVLVYRGEVLDTAHKALLPTYDVFDEARYFDPAEELHVLPFKGERLGLHICEDAWTEPEIWDGRLPYACNPIRTLVDQSATILINLSASPYNMGKESIRHRLISQHARRYGLPFVYVNQVGGNDELVFDGRSLFLDGKGEALAVLPGFREHVLTVDTLRPPDPQPFVHQEEIASVHDALVLGLSDYMRKCGFSRAVIGLSGGIDSAVTCALAANALGPENVLGVSMPSQYSSVGSVDDARELARNLGIDYRAIPIRRVFDGYLGVLAEALAGTDPDVTEENIQARIRGNYLMALSNKFGYLVLSTGNKSELAVGYCTLYGDMSGGLAVISDVPKMMVYELARYMNRYGKVIPQGSIDKPPSAELRPNQRDQDSLPPYEVLDAILADYVQDGLSVDEITAKGFEGETVRWVARTVDRNEFKRQQAAPGLRVTSKAFGVGRRMPIAARFER